MRAKGTLPLLGFLLAACASAVVPRPQQGDVERARTLDPTADLPRLERGRDRFVRKCGGCHGLPDPRDRKPDEWPEQVDDMAKRARLHGTEQEDITLYLRVFALP